MREGKCIQILHIGPYYTEPESIVKMEKLMEEKNLVKSGFHHEIYLVMAYPRKVPEEKLKTILRQPVKEKPIKNGFREESPHRSSSINTSLA